MAAFKVPSVFTAVDRLTAPVRNMTSSVQGFAMKADRAINKVNSRLSLMNKQIRGTVMLGAAMALSMGAYGGAGAVMELDKSMSAAAAKFQIFDRGSNAFKKIRQTALDLGATTEFTAGQVAEGFKSLATAGFKYEQAIAGIPRILDLATATQQDFAIASDVSAKSLRAFGLMSEDPKKLNGNLLKVTDTLNKIITTSGFGNLEEFLDVISQSGSVARASGVDIQTWGAIVASSVSEAVPASKAGTRFSNMLSYMSKNLDTFTKAGIKVADANGNYRDFIDIMKDVEKTVKGMGAVERASYLFDLFGERGRKMAESILSNGVAALEKYREEIRASEGISQKMASFMRSGLTGAVNATKSAFEAIAIAIGDTFQPEIDASIQNLITVARAARGWIEANKGLLKVLLKISVIVLKIWVAFKLLVLAIKIMKAVTIGYNIVLGITTALMGKNLFAIRGNTIAMKAHIIATKAAAVAMRIFNWVMRANPIGFVITAIAALGYGIYKMIQYWDSWGSIVAAITGPLGMVVSIIMSISRHWEKIKEAFKNGGIINGIKQIGLAILDGIIQPFESLSKWLNQLTGWNFGDKFLSASRDAIGKAIDITAKGEQPQALNTDATRETLAVERTESTERSRLDININDPGGNASVDKKDTSNNMSIQFGTTWGAAM